MIGRILIFIAGAAVLLALQDVLPKWALAGSLFLLFCFTGVGDDGTDDDDGPTSWIWGLRFFLLIGACGFALVGWLVFSIMKK